MLLRVYEFLKIPEGRPIKFVGKYWRKFIDSLVVSYIKKKQIPSEPLNKEKREEKVIASLTSFPARIDCAEFAIKSLMLQDYKPDRIILWLSNKQFNGEDDLPKSLLKLKDYGLEIIFCDDDLRGHKKYFEILQVQKEDELVVTFDDDIIYPHNSISRLIELHKKYPKAIITNRGYEIKFNDDGSIKPHEKWELQSRYGVKQPANLILTSTGSGILYPYNSFYHDIFNDKNIKKYALSIDDLWITIMAILNDTKIIKSHYAVKTFTTYPGTQENQLGLENMRNPENVDKHDTVVKDLMDDYPILKEKITKENK